MRFAGARIIGNQALLEKRRILAGQCFTLELGQGLEGVMALFSAKSGVF